ncbi:MAG: outer membrane lipoprotein LolB [Proteobacteria bacterium]|nr:outer membrane lipoprotein LolB [Pseudomonadota bacterium]
MTGGTARAPRFRGSPRMFVALRAIVATCVLAVIAGCATRPPPVSHAPPPVAEAFSLQGRISVRHGTDALAANVAWTHSASDDHIELATPLGTGIARMTRDASGATIELADGRRERAASFATLTEASLGVPIPVAGLASWVQGAPRAGSAARIERDGAGRTSTLDQDGWSIVYAYADDAATRPRRLVATYPDIDLRLVIDAWR